MRNKTDIASIITVDDFELCKDFEMKEAKEKSTSKLTANDLFGANERTTRPQRDKMSCSVYDQYYDYQLFNLVELAKIEKKEREIAEKKKWLCEVNNLNCY